MSSKTVALAFAAGALGVLVFHQVLILLLYLANVVPQAPYSFRSTAPFHVPQVFSLAFWGGLWGICMILVLQRIPGANRFWAAFLFGGIFPPLVAALIVTPLKGGNMADWLSVQRLFLSFVINGVWGLGAFLCYRLGRQWAR